MMEHKQVERGLQGPEKKVKPAHSRKTVSAYSTAVIDGKDSANSENGHPSPAKTARQAGQKIAR